MTASPSNHEPLFALAIEMLLASYEVPYQVPDLVAPLTGPHVGWDGLAPHALVVALGAPSADVRNAATDALVEAAARGRLPAERLGEALAWVLTTGRVPCGRAAKSLAQAATASARHAAFVADAIEASLCGERARWPRDLLALLELLQELRTRSGTRVTTPAAREFLAAISGGGRAAKVAAALRGDGPRSSISPSGGR
jgi:hypothetical protein